MRLNLCRANQMPDKRAPIGICDQCGGAIPAAEHYTSKGRPRLYCSRDCRNTANSRAGAPVRARKARQRVARGEWRNPAKLHPPDPTNVAAGVSRARKSEVRAGRWRNPALTDAARRKLSRPRKHRGVLARAIERIGIVGSAGLTPAERRAYYRWRRELAAPRAEAIRAAARQRYRARQAALTPRQRDRQRATWRAQNKRRSKRRG